MRSASSSRVQVPVNHHEKVSPRDLPPASPANDIVTVSAIVGAGDDAHRLARMGAWTLVVPADDVTAERPRIRDVDLGERLGYTRTKDIRLLAREHEKAGNINPFHVRAAVARTGAVSRTEDEMWFSEEDALWLVSQSKTTKAVALTKEMIRVYTMVRRHLLGEYVGPLREALGRKDALATAQARDIEQLRLENRLLREQQTNGVIPGLSADWLREQVAYLAPLLAELGWCPRKQTLRAAYGVLHHGIATQARWGKVDGETLERMPITSFPHAKAYLSSMRRAVESELRRRQRERAKPPQAEQLGLFVKSTDKPN